MLSLNIKSIEFRKGIGAAFVKFIGWSMNKSLADNSLIEMGDIFIAIANMEAAMPISNATLDDLVRAYMPQSTESLVNDLLQEKLIMGSEPERQVMNVVKLEATVRALNTPLKGKATVEGQIRNFQEEALTQLLEPVETTNLQEVRELIKKDIVSPHEGMKFCLDGTKQHDERYLLQLKFAIVRVFAIVINNCFGDDSYLKKFDQLLAMSKSGNPHSREQLDKVTDEVENFIQKKENASREIVQGEQKVKKEQKGSALRGGFFQVKTGEEENEGTQKIVEGKENVKKEESKFAKAFRSLDTKKALNQSLEDIKAELEKDLDSIEVSEEASETTGLN